MRAVSRRAALGIARVHQSPIGVGGPKEMDAKVIVTIDAAFRKAAQEPQFARVLEQFALVPLTLEHPAYTRCMHRAYEREGQLPARLGLKGGGK